MLNSPRDTIKFRGAVCEGCETELLTVFDINLDVVWETVQLALPELIVQLDAVRRAPGANDRNGQAV